MRVIAWLLAFVALAGCGGGAESNPPEGGGADGDTIPVPQPDESCTSEFPHELAVTWTGSESAGFVDQVTACIGSSQSGTYIRNDSGSVFTISATVAGTPVTHLSNAPTLTTFRSAAAEVYRYPDAVLSPGEEVVVGAEPTDVQWTLHPGLSGMWLAYDTLVDEVAQFGEEQVTQMLVGNSLRGRALLTCSLTAYHAVGEVGSLLDTSQPANEVLSALGVFGESTSCARAWQAADQEVLGRFPRTATWTDDILRLGEDAAFISRANTELSRWRQLGRVLARLVES